MRWAQSHFFGGAATSLYCISALLRCSQAAPINMYIHQILLFNHPESYSNTEVCGNFDTQEIMYSLNLIQGNHKMFHIPKLKEYKDSYRLKRSAYTHLPLTYLTHSTCDCLWLNSNLQCIMLATHKIETLTDRQCASVWKFLILWYVQFHIYKKRILWCVMINLLFVAL